MTRVVLATASRDRGSTSRTLEAWTRLLPAEHVCPTVTIGGDGPLLTALQAAGVPVFVRPLRVVPRKTWPFPFLYAAGRLALTVKKAGASVVHVNEHDNHIVASYAASLARVPIFTHIRFRPDVSYCRWLFRPGRVPARLFFTSHTQLADSAAAVRPVVPEDRWRVLPNGLDFSLVGIHPEHRARLRSEWGLGDESVAIGIACAISVRKRVDHLIRLVAGLRARGVDAFGFVAGQPHFPSDAPVLDDLRRLAAELGLGDRIRFLGYVEPSEPLYYAWDLCVSTSSYETFGMTVLEAMACRCPVVTYPGGSVQEIVGDAAIVVPDGDEASLLSAALPLAMDPAARRALGERGRAHASATYDIRRIVPVLASEYKQAS
jgi:glycosyltransferase involved in cell wall biosynthesis